MTSNIRCRFLITSLLLLLQDNDQYLQSKNTWVNEQHELILVANRWALKNIMHSVNKTTLCAGGSPLDIPKDNLVLVRDHPEGRHKIQDNYKSELFVVVSKHRNPNVDIILPLCGVQYIQSMDDNYSI